MAQSFVIFIAILLAGLLLALIIHANFFWKPTMVYKEPTETWIAVFKCVKCHKELTHNQRRFSSGVCPLCGHTSSGTVCDTIKDKRCVKTEGRWEDP